jgi:hypothetical protein
MGRTRLVMALVAAIALVGPALSPVRVAAGAVCDLKVSVERGEPSDGPVEFYRRWNLFISGSGFPPSVMLDVEILADSALVHDEQLPVQADGTVARAATFIGFLVDPSDQPVDFLVTAEDPANPSGCSDSIQLLRLPEPPFDDIVFSRFLEEIIWLHDEGLLAGCRPSFFCGSNAVTRGEMAVLLVRARALAPTTDDFFADDDGHKYEWAINRLAAAGVTQGCGPDAFCPNGLISRDEMASFLVAAFELPPSADDRFTDDDGSSHESAINALAAAGVTTGCSSISPERFCPLKLVTREQLAAFLYRAMN